MSTGKKDMFDGSTISESEAGECVVWARRGLYEVQLIGYLKPENLSKFNEFNSIKAVYAKGDIQDKLDKISEQLHELAEISEPIEKVTKFAMITAIGYFIANKIDFSNTTNTAEEWYEKMFSK